MKKQHTYLFIVFILFAFYENVKAQCTVVVTNPASPWTIPAGVTSITVYCWGGGGGSGGGIGNAADQAGGGGGGGACTVATFAVTTGNTCTLTYGAGGTAGANAGTLAAMSGGTGGTTTLNYNAGTNIVTATGGGGGGGASTAGAQGTAGAASTGGSGGITNNGGTGSAGVSSGVDEVGGAGGGSGGSGGAGGNGTNPGGVPAANTIGGTAGTGTEPGVAGAGAFFTGSNLPGVAGSAPGGGAAGAATYTTKELGAIGGAGQVIITYTVSPPVVAAIGGGTNPLCVGAASAGFTDATAGGTWSITNGTGSATNVGAVVTGGAAGAVTVNYAVTNAGCTTTVTYALTINGPPTVAAIGGGAATVCVGSTTATFTDATGGGTWSITNGTGSATIVNATGVVTGVSAGSVTVNYAVTNACGTTTVTKALTVNTVPTVAAIGGGAVSVCVGSTTPAFTDATGGGTWSITNGTGSATIVNATGVVTGVSAGAVTVNYVVTNACGTTTITTALTILAIPTNDLCGGATNLGTVSTTTTIADNNTCATNTGTDPNPSCNSNTVSNTVWYSFTTSSAGTATVSLTHGTITKASISVYNSSSCPSTASEIGCTSGHSSNTFNPSVSLTCLSASTTYYIMVWEDGGAGGTYNLTVATTAGTGAPSNDLCAGAIGLTSGTTITNGNNTCAGSTGDPGTGLCSDGSSAASSVWYSYTPALSGQLTITIAAGTITWPVATIVSSTGACAGYALATSIPCGYSAATSFTATACLTAGTQYYVIVGSDISQSGATGTFSLTPTFIGLTNDNCAAATAIGTVASGSSGSVSSTNACATADQTGSNTGSCFSGTGNANQNVWYTFTTDANPGAVTVTLNGVVMQYPQVAMFSGNCGGFTQLGCSDDNSSTAGPATFSYYCPSANTTYYIEVDNNNGNTAGTFSLNVAVASPCSGTPNAGGAVASVTSGCTTYASVISLQASNCGGITYQWQSSTNNVTYTNIAGQTSATYNATVSQNTWYQCIITCTASGLSTTSSPAFCSITCQAGVAVNSAGACSGGNYTANLSLTGTSACSGQSYQWQSSSNGTTWANIGGATASTYNGPSVTSGTYYQCVMTCNSGNATSTATPVYCTWNTSGTSNNTCANAYNVPTSNLNGTWNSGFNFSCATYDAECQCNTCHGSCSGCCPNTWFTFTAQGPDLEVTGGSSGFTPIIDIFQGSACGSLSYVGGCAQPGTFNNGEAAGFTYAITAGTQYYVMVTNTSCSAVNSTYSLQINNPTPNPAGTDCATGQILCSNGSFGGAADLWGTQELTSATVYDCNLEKEINSNWYVINVLQGGTWTFTLTAADGVDDYDYALYSGASCTLGAPISCNYSSYPGVTGISSSNCGGSCSNSTPAYATYASTWNTTQTLSAGTYIFYINGFTPSSEGFNFTMGGTAVLGCTLPTVLPISLVSFNATLDGNQVDLDWSTATEINNDYFTIERSSDGTNFQYLTKVKGAGNSNDARNYSTIDYEPLPGTSYYRLSQTDFNGNTQNLTIKSVSNTNDDGMFTIMPNPTTGILNINYSCGAATTGMLNIYDANGALVTSKQITCVTGTNKTQLDLGDKAIGIYLVTFTTNDKFYRTKLVKR